MSTNAIRHVNLNGSIAEYEKCLPVLVSFKKNLYKVSTWANCLKIVFYSLYETTKGKEAIDSVIADDLYNNMRNSDFSLDKLKFAVPVKFSKDTYLRCYNSDGEKNIKLIKKVNDIIDIPVSLWVCDKRLSADAIQDEIEDIIAPLTVKGMKNRMYEKNTSYYIAHINGKVFSDEEKCFFEVERQFDKKILIGDVLKYLPSGGEDTINQYMSMELKRLVAGSAGTFAPYYPKVFAVGLVEYARKYYSERTFWPYFNDEYGVSFSANKQAELHSVFRKIMIKNGKSYNDYCAQKIDNISMHCFVTDKCAAQFFNYLFDFWRIDLSSNIDNLRSEDFDTLINEITAGHQNVMTHTSMAIKMNEKSCKTRIRRFLRLIDDCYWQQTVIPETGNRFNNLLRAWIEDDKGVFKKARNATIRKKGVRGETLLSAPVLRMDVSTGDFYIRFPREILKQGTDEDYPFWNVEVDGKKYSTIEPELNQGKLGFYTEECTVPISPDLLYSEFSLELFSRGETICSFKITKTDLRLFNEKGKNPDLSSGVFPEGNIRAFCKHNDAPYKIFCEKPSAEFINGLFVSEHCYNKGEIIILPGNTAVSVGEAIREGITTDNLMGGVVAISNGKESPVYSAAPKLVFKATKEQLSGTSISVNGSISKVTARRYSEFRLDETLEEIYAYVVDLSDYMAEDGIFSVFLKIPNSRSIHNYEFSLIGGFDFCFDNSPYVFKDSGSLTVKKAYGFAIDDNWDISGEKRTFVFNFGALADDDVSDEVSEDKKHLRLKYQFPAEKAVLQFEIPALYWRFSESDDWFCKKPADMYYTKIPENLYVDGPGDIINKNGKLYIEMNTSVTAETEIYPEYNKNGNGLVFRFNNIKSWVDQDVNLRKVMIRFSDKIQREFVRIVCRSILLSGKLSGDFINNILYGSFDIVGEGEYCVSISYNGEVIESDIPLTDGQFTLETNICEGVYEAALFENQADEFGFDVLSYPVQNGKCSIVLADPRNLEGKNIILKSVHDIRKRFSSLDFGQNIYILNNLRKMPGINDILDNGDDLSIWRYDLTLDEDVSSLENSVCYSAGLGNINYAGDFKFRFNVLVIFCNPNDIKNIIICKASKETNYTEYSEMLYDKTKNMLIFSDARYNRKTKKENLILLSDDQYIFDFEIK